MKARDIMTGSIVVVTAKEPVGHAARLMEEHDVGLLPVVDDLESMRLQGVITDRDLAVRHVARDHGPACLIEDHMTRPPLAAVNLDDHVHDVMGRMRHEQLRRLPVLDPEHRLVGVIAQADIVRRLGADEPRQVEQMIEGISGPGHLVAR